MCIVNCIEKSYNLCVGYDVTISLDFLSPHTLLHAMQLLNDMCGNDVTSGDRFVQSRVGNEVSCRTAD